MFAVRQVADIQRFQELIYLRLFTDCFMKISLQSSEQTHILLCMIVTDGRVVRAGVSVAYNVLS